MTIAATNRLNARISVPKEFRLKLYRKVPEAFYVEERMKIFAPERWFFPRRKGLFRAIEKTIRY